MKKLISSLNLESERIVIMYEMIKDFKNLSAPPPEKVAEMQEQIRIIKNAMGYKYRLAVSMPRIKQGN